MHKCFISFKKEDQWYRNKLISDLGGENFIDKSLDRRIDSYDGDYIMQVIRKDYLRDSTVTLFLIGTFSAENAGYDIMGDRNYFIKKELAASLFNGEGNTRSGIVGIVLPDMYDRIFRGIYICSQCGYKHENVCVSDDVVIREFGYNYFTEPHNRCAWGEEDRYCVLVKWDDFIKDPERYINQAFDKRFSDIAQKIRIRNLR